MMKAATRTRNMRAVYQAMVRDGNRMERSFTVRVYPADNTSSAQFWRRTSLPARPERKPVILPNQ